MTEDSTSTEKRRLLQLASVHAQEITKSFNPQELLAILVEQNVLCDEERKSITSITCRREQRERLFDCFRRSPDIFVQCLEKEKNHCGHKYILALVKEEVFGISSQIQKSHEYEKTVHRRREEIVSDTDMTYLVPCMLNRGLLTWSEYEELQKQATYDGGKSAYLLDEILPTKGPLAFLRFVDCLEQERKVPRHAELFELITGHKPLKRCLENSSETESDENSDHESISLVSREKPKVKKRRIIGLPQEPLTGATYEGIMKILWESHHGGEWDILEREVKRLVDDRSTNSQLKVVVLLELARSHIFRHNWKLVNEYIQSAKSLIDGVLNVGTHSRVNTAYLLCQTELISSLRYLFSGEFQKAQEHLDLAKEALFNVDVSVPYGEYAAWISYCSGCVRLEKLYNLSKRDIHEQHASVMKDFEAVIHCACLHNKPYDPVRTHAYLRLAQFYLDCSHFTIGTARNQERIDQARICLQIDSVHVTSLPLRSQAFYYIVLSDYSRSTKAIADAHKYAQKAIDIANVGFLTEKNAAIKRLEALKDEKEFVCS